MLIKESDMSYTNRSNPMSLLNEMTYIEENTSPALVPVIESNRLGSYIIDLNDIMNFSEASNNEDLGQCLSLICESNEINPNNVVFSIDGYKLLEDNNLANMVQGLLSEGVSVYQKLLSANSPAYILAEEAINNLVMDNDISLLEAYCSDDISALLEMSKRSQRKAARKLMIANATGDHKSADAIAGRSNTRLDKPILGNYDPGSTNYINRERSYARGISQKFQKFGKDNDTSSNFKVSGIHPSLRPQIKNLKDIKDPQERKSQMNKLFDMNQHLQNMTRDIAGNDETIKHYQTKYDGSDKNEIMDYLKKNAEEEKNKHVDAAKKIGLKNFDVDALANNPEYLRQSEQERRQNAKKLNKVLNTAAEARKQRDKSDEDFRQKKLDNREQLRIAKRQETDKRTMDLVQTLSSISNSLSEKDVNKLSGNQGQNLIKIKSAVRDGGKGLDQNSLRSLIKQAKSIKNTIDNSNKPKNQNNIDAQSEPQGSQEQPKPTESAPQNDAVTKQVTNTIQNAEKEAENKPKSWLAQKIYALRQLYSKWLVKKNQEHDQNKIGFFSNILRIIAKGIDWLLKKLQHMTD